MVPGRRCDAVRKGGVLLLVVLGVAALPLRCRGGGRRERLLRILLVSRRLSVRG